MFDAIHMVESICIAGEPGLMSVCPNALAYKGSSKALVPLTKWLTSKSSGELTDMTCSSYDGNS